MTLPTVPSAKSATHRIPPVTRRLRQALAAIRDEGDLSGAVLGGKQLAKMGGLAPCLCELTTGARNVFPQEVRAPSYSEGMPAKVYLDTNVYKFSATQLPRLRVEMKEVSWGGRKQVLPLHVPIIVDPNERIDEASVLRAEVDLLPEVAGLAKRGFASFLISVETQVELSGIPDLDSQTGYFYSAPHTTVQPPVRYSRILYGGPEDPLEAQYRFLRGLDDPRFLELRRICGAEQGKEVNRNQLLGL